MALVTITKNDTGVRSSFVSPGYAARARPPDAPIAKIVYEDTVTITAKGANDETKLALNILLPDNFFYRCLFFDWTAISSGVIALQPTTGFELAARGEILTNSATAYRFMAYNEVSLTTAAQANAFKINDDSVTSDFGAYYCADLSKFFFLGANSSAIKVIWMDTSADATAAVFMTYRVEVLQFTIEQGIDFDTNKPALTYF